MTKQQEEYVLGTGADELERLAIQHRIWADAAVGAWKRAGIGPGSKVIDLGSGPGHATMDLAQLVGPSGLIFAVDESQDFVNYLKSQASARKLLQLKAVLGDAQNLGMVIPDSSVDIVYCRWVLCWLANPAIAIANVFRALKPGGRFVIHDYFNWQSMCLAPRSPAIERMVKAAIESFEARSGNIDIAAKLPKLLREQGFKEIHFEVHQRVARGGGLDSTIVWPVTWWRTYGPKLVEQGRFSKEDMQQVLRDLAQLETDPDLFFVCPPVYEFIVKK